MIKSKQVCEIVRAPDLMEALEIVRKMHSIPASAEVKACNASDKGLESGKWRVRLSVQWETNTQRPPNCRERLRLQGDAYPKSGCAACGSGGLTGCPHE